MRKPRIKVPHGTDGIYHCFSRAVDGKFIFGKREKDKFLEMMWRIADFLGIQVLHYTLMSNHYHQILFVPGIVSISNEELLERLGQYYGHQSREYLEFLAAVQRGDKSPDLLRKQYIIHMCNLSEFEKRLKQGFSSWYNKRKDRKGALWMERFGSTVTEDRPNSTMAMAGYLDLNPVRAGLVDDPKDYPYCAYSAALRGCIRCQEGLKRITGICDWDKAAADYRVFIMLKGHRKISDKKGNVSRSLLLQTLDQEGQLSLPDLLRLKVRYFTDGLAFGSESFVESLFQENRDYFSHRRKAGAMPIDVLPAAGLSVINKLHKTIFM